MQDKQRLIAEWMNEVMARKGISATKWAQTAKLGKDTVSRAIREDYEHVTTTTTIAKLAEAVGERPYGAAAGVPSVESLESILAELHVMLLGEQPLDRETTRALAAGLRDTLLHLADEPESQHDHKVLSAVARSSGRRHALASARSQKS